MNARIMIGYDGSPNSADALLLGKRLCEALGAEAVVGCCLPIPRYLMGQELLEEAVREDTEANFRRAREGLEGIEVRTEATADGSPARTLFELAEREQPLLVVVGSSHRGPLGRVLLGSVGQRLAGALPCGLAVAPHGYATRQRGGLVRLGVGVDGGPESDAALRVGIQLAERLDARLRVISVETAPKIAYSAAPGVAVVDLQRSEAEHAARVLKDAVEAVDRKIPVDGVQPRGDPATVLGQESKDLDLIVLGSRGYGPAKRILLGSVSARLMHNAGCPLLVIPRSAGEDPLRLEVSSAGSLVGTGAEGSAAS